MEILHSSIHLCINSLGFSFDKHELLGSPFMEYQYKIVNHIKIFFLNVRWFVDFKVNKFQGISST